MGFSIGGSILGGILASRVSLFRALILTSVLRIFPLLGQVGLSIMPVLSDDLVLITICAEHFFGGALTTVMFAMMMSNADKTSGATQFTALATAEVLGKAPSSWLSGVVADWGGYTLVFSTGAVLSIAFLLILPLAKPEQENQRTA